MCYYFQQRVLIDISSRIEKRGLPKNFNFLNIKYIKIINNIKIYVYVLLKLLERIKKYNLQLQNYENNTFDNYKS